MIPEIIAVDIGTSSCKAVLFSDTGEHMAEGRSSYPLLILKDGMVEQDPEVIFQQILNALKQIEEKVKDLSQLQAISFCAQMSAQFLVDDRGRPLTNIISWMDQRAVIETEQVRAAFTREQMEQISGMDMVITPAYSIPKLLWIKKYLPEQLEKSSRFVQIKDYVIFRLTGRWISDPTSLKGLVNQKSGEPLREIWEYLKLDPEILPQVQKPYEIAGNLQTKELGLTKIPRGIPVVTGWNDMNAAFLGMGALLEDGIGLDMTGTSEHLGWVGKESHVPQEQYNGNNRVPYLDGREVFYGVSSSSGLTVEWYVRDFLKKEKVAEYIQQTLKDFDYKTTEDLLFLPYLEGERNPWNNPLARGVFFGINKGHRQKHMMAAVLEGICFELNAIYQCLPYKPSRVIVSGGASYNAVWNQMKADVWGVKLETVNVKEAGCTGAAVLAKKALEPERSLKEISQYMISVTGEIDPDMERHGFYTKKYKRFIELYETVKRLFK